MHKYRKINVKINGQFEFGSLTGRSVRLRLLLTFKRPTKTQRAALTSAEKLLMSLKVKQKRLVPSMGDILKIRSTWHTRKLKNPLRINSCIPLMFLQT